MKKLIAAVTTAGLVIVGTAGLAGAADSPSTTTSGKAAPSEQSRGQQGRRLAALGTVAATTIGIDPKELREAVKGGQTIAEVAQSHDVEPGAVVDAMVAAIKTRVDSALAAGKIDAERAAKITTKAPERLTKVVNGDYQGKGARHAKRAKLRRHARRGAAAVAAKTIGIEPSALRDAVKGGQSVADVAQSHDVDPQAVIDAVVSAGNTRIDAAVAADRITAERAAKVKERLSERVTRLVNATPRERG